jgi:hypothetical protein
MCDERCEENLSNYMRCPPRARVGDEERSRWI